MPRMKINGVEHEFPAGINVLDACLRVGVFIPHFCYHPALSVAGSCRMCKVEVIQGGRSRVDISCNLLVGDGLEVNTDSPPVKKAQQMTLEYLLANHPLDCPICDDAGECDLQNYYLAYGRHPSRFHELKIRKNKAKDIGRSIVLDSERCVLCSRCVRFFAEVTKTNELDIFGMGVTEELTVRPGARVDNDYAGNIVDLCPVGALTDKDFRFKRRVWYLHSAMSVCQLCSRGCNVRIDYDVNPFHVHKPTFQMKTHRTPHTAHARIQRLKPRENNEVNGHWMCDHGRYGYRATDAADRLLHPLIVSDGVPQKVELITAVREMATGINKAIGGGADKIAVIASPQLANEELFAVWALFCGKLKLPNLDHRLPIPADWCGDDLLRTPDSFPNRTGAEWVGVLPEAGGISISNLPAAIQAGKVDTLVSIFADPREYLDEADLKKLKRCYLIVRNLPSDLQSLADVALPATAWGEYRGTFVNFQGRIQRLEQAFEPLGDALPVWRLMDRLGEAMKRPLGFNSLGDVWNSLSRQVSPFAGVSWDVIGPEGVLVPLTQQAKAAG